MLYTLLAASFCIIGSYSACNYVYVNATDTAWATNVCIYNSATKKYFKYECPSSSDSNQDTLYFSEFSDSYCDAQSDHYDLIERINGSFVIDYDCSGYNGCYVDYLVNCNHTDDSLEKYHVYSPVDTCITKNDGTSFQFECDDDDFHYVLYDNSNCELNVDISSQRVTSCATFDLNTGTKQWQYQNCVQEPTPSPTPPTLSPTKATSSPTRRPTVTIPDFLKNNKTYEDIINDINKKSDAISFHPASIFTISLSLFIFCLCQ